MAVTAPPPTPARPARPPVQPAGTKVVFPILATAKITDKPYGTLCVSDLNNDGQLDFAVSDRTGGSESAGRDVGEVRTNARG